MLLFQLIMAIQKLPKKAPNTPGVYIFRRGKIAIYVGKAENLRKRLASYFRKNAGAKVESLREEATRLEWNELSSDIEALIKESELIKKYRPKYNILMRDDKNYFYVGFSQDEFPKIFITHQPFRTENCKLKIENSSYVGPFTSGSALYQTLKILRRIFPYCTCKKFHTRPCLNAQISRCPGFCCYSPPIVNPFKTRSYFKWQNEYHRNIQNITAVLCGKKKTLIRKLRKEMREAAKKEEFERAAELQKQIEGIENIFLHRMFLDHALAKQRRGHDWQKIERTIQALFGTMRRIRRVEGYDISNISGTAATGSMAVFVDGAPSKNNYRKFKIKTVTGISDVDMHREVLNRRFRHSDGWGTPDLLLIDGGKPQVSAALQALQMRKVKGILLAGLAKREEELFLPGRRDPIRLDFLPAHTSHFFQHVRDESHRFAKKYHHKLREISYRNESR
ncbi:MAG: excinuclease ABC subunit C [Parcubacteria group bacterium GW2011_GWB1_50_9]|uniref:Excinuclease ABC subunit C n=2 Tax=Parcubacteria group TaxID=1794811 RepID=A0A0G1WJM0_9BACT|nr:MAG: excinuclease ABC subunit C [Parcubacteria group bacterium GW2011_GWB1_50_9]KKW18966.1 MAG: excinuclease ABC subunit C [Candidatus Adlerbacteria bacterium GW2011_GWC1_50_9]